MRNDDLEKTRPPKTGDECQDLVKTVLNFRDSLNAENSWTG